MMNKNEKKTFKGVTFTYDDDSAPTRVYGTLTPLNTNTIYRVSKSSIKFVRTNEHDEN